MILNSFVKKSILAVLLAYGSVVWLTFWHEFGYGSRLDFPPISDWPRDAMIIFLPVMLAIWASVALAKWLVKHSHKKLSPWSQSMLMIAILGGMTSFAIILIEANRVFLTGIGNEVAIQVSLCRNLNPNSSILLKALLGIFPSTQALRYHVLLNDGMYLALINVGITVVLVLILEGFVSYRNTRRLKTV